MKSIWKAVEKATNIAVILAVCVMAIWLYRTGAVSPRLQRSGASFPCQVIAGNPVRIALSSSSEKDVIFAKRACRFIGNSTIWKKTKT